MKDIEEQYYDNIQNQCSFIQQELVDKFFSRIYKEYAKPLQDIANILNGLNKRSVISGNN